MLGHSAGSRSKSDSSNNLNMPDSRFSDCFQTFAIWMTHSFDKFTNIQIDLIKMQIKKKQIDW